MNGRLKMDNNIVCPFCGAVNEYFCFDTDFSCDGEHMYDNCRCEKCNGYFNIIYKYKMERIVPKEREENEITMPDM